MTKLERMINGKRIGTCGVAAEEGERCHSAGPNRRRAPRRGFTLIELLVVIGIIVLLMAILLAAISGARKQARYVESQALLTGLGLNIAAYYQDWNDYPGPYSDVDIANNAGTFTGNQNLYLMTKRWAPNSASPNPPLVSPTTLISVAGKAINVELGSTSQPLDPATNKAYGPYYNAKPNETALPSALGIPGVAQQFPMIVDRYSDPLPILYYRATKGVDNVTGDQTKVTLAVPSGTTTIAPFYQNVNLAITSNANLKAASGVRCPQSLLLSDLDGMLSQTYNNVETKKGAWVLISAGWSRHFGPVNGKNDNIVVAGGM